MTTPNLKLTSIKLGDSATPANNFLVSVPDIANGTLTIEREDGTDVCTIDAAGKVVFPGNTQTWQDVTGSRSAGTTYTNSTTQSIQIAITSVSSGATDAAAYLTVTVGGIVVQQAQSYGVYVNAWATFTVPAGATYSVATTGGTLGIAAWKELR